MIQWNVLWRKAAQPWRLFPPCLDKPLTMNSQCTTVAKRLNSVLAFRVVNMNRNLLMSPVSLLLLFIYFFFNLLAQAKRNSERRKGWVKCILNADGFFKRFLQISLKPGKCENYKQSCLFEEKSRFYLKENFKRKYCKQLYLGLWKQDRT